MTAPSCDYVRGHVVTTPSCDYEPVLRLPHLQHVRPSLCGLPATRAFVWSPRKTPGPSDVRFRCDSCPVFVHPWVIVAVDEALALLVMSS